MTSTTPAPTLETLVLIPPILDCIVTYIHTIDLLAWTATSRTTHDCLKASQAAWRAISFYTPTRSFDRRENSISVFDSTIAVRSHNFSGGEGSSPGSSGLGYESTAATSTGGVGVLGGGAAGYNHWNAMREGKLSRCLSVDMTLTVLGRTLPLSLYTCIDLSRTKADKHLLRDLMDYCHGLRYLVLEDCPKVRVADIVLGLYGVEKKVLKRWKEEVEGRGECWMGGSETVSLVAEVMGRLVPKVDGKGDGNSGSNGGGSNGTGAPASANALARLTHIHTKEVRDGLYRMHELKDAVRGDIVRVMSKMEDVYTYPDMPAPVRLDKKPLQLREIRTDIRLHRSSYNGPGWLERLAYSQGDYLFMLCHLIGVRLIHAD